MGFGLGDFGRLVFGSCLGLDLGLGPNGAVATPFKVGVRVRAVGVMAPS